MGFQIVLALGQTLLVGVNIGDGIQRGTLGCHQAVVYLDGLFSHDVGTVTGQQVVDLIDGSGGAVFDGHHAIISTTFFQCNENFFPGTHFVAGSIFAEEQGGRLVGISPWLALVKNTGIVQRSTNFCPVSQIAVKPNIVFLHQLALLFSADGHNALKQSGQVTLHGRIIGQGGLGSQNFFFPALIQHVHMVAHLVLANLVGHTHALLEQGGDLTVNDVDFVAQCF